MNFSNDKFKSGERYHWLRRNKSRIFKCYLICPIVPDTKDEARENFYQNINREEAENLLRNRQNGTFVIRPSLAAHSLGTMSIVQEDKIFHLNVRRRDDGLIALGVQKFNEKAFGDLSNLINYYVSNYLVLCSEGIKCNALLIPYL